MFTEYFISQACKGSFRGHERDTIVDGRKIITLLVTIRFDNIFVIVG